MIFNLPLHMNKTRAIAINFGKKRMAADVDVVKEFKYLGGHINIRLNWKTNIKAAVQKDSTSQGS